MVRKILGVALIVVAGAVLLYGASSSSFGQGKGKKGRRKAAPYVHTVIFYLKKDAPKGTVRNVIEDSHKLLAKIPSVRLLRVGRPAKKDTEGYAKKDYDVGLTILFENYEGLDTYLRHELHLQFVAKYKDAFDRVLVFDYSNQRK